MESFNRRRRDECLNTEDFADITEARAVLERAPRVQHLSAPPITRRAHRRRQRRSQPPPPPAHYPTRARRRPIATTPRTLRRQHARHYRRNIRVDLPESQAGWGRRGFRAVSGALLCQPGDGESDSSDCGPSSPPVQWVVSRSGSGASF
ncbi:MAG: transposase [Acidimicrobiia bacterium]|nr:transposase [Acidimicrobiia bacterium]MYC45361.1 transposase [Acidimicrobiia bacterium]MYI20666.1 transposase [Acidimicrobiia bacterium]